MYNWVPVQYSRNEPSIVNQLYFSEKEKKSILTGYLRWDFVESMFQHVEQQKYKWNMSSVKLRWSHPM